MNDRRPGRSGLPSSELSLASSVTSSHPAGKAPARETTAAAVDGVLPRIDELARPAAA
jgi:hypothetical protein